MANRPTIVIVGGVAAGAGAAAKARRMNEDAEVIVYEKGEHVSFANCGLPYYVSGEIEKQSELLLHTPQSLKERFNLDVFVRHEVFEIDPKEHRVMVRDNTTRETFYQTYDKLILAPGAKPIIPPLEGVQSENVRQLRSVPDALQIKELIDAKQAKQVVVIGGGFIGLEAIEGLCRQSIAVTMVEKADQVMTPFDKEMVVGLEGMLRKLGVQLIFNNGVSRFIAEGSRARAIELEDGTVLEADLFLLSIGVRPDVDLAKKAGVTLGASGAIAVNENMETNVPDVYAAGDAVETKHLVTGAPVWIPLAGPANKQGRIAGANAAGGDMKFSGAFGTSIVRVADVVAAKTGLSEKECQRGEIAHQITYSYHGHHAGYYPGAEGMMIKLLSEPGSGRILGAQIVGGSGVDKRIDVIATAIYGGMTVEDLENLDLAYAPPFGAAKDPVIMAGMAHANVNRGEIQAFTPTQFVEQKGQRKLQIVDVREPKEWEKGIIEGAICMSLGTIRERFSELDVDAETVVYCLSGQRSYIAARMLAQKGVRHVTNLTGGYLAWTQYAQSRAL